MSEWKPGDVANGHVLTQDGVWAPLPQWVTAPLPEPRQPLFPRKVGWWFAGGAVALIAVVSMASSNDSTPSYTASDTTSSVDKAAATAELAWGTIEQTDRDNICAAYAVSPSDTETLVRTTDSIGPELVSPIMDILAREC